MKRADIISQYEDTGTALIPLNGLTTPQARSLARGAAAEIGARITTHAIEMVVQQGTTHVVADIQHGPVDARGCYICRKTAERLARILWRYTLDQPELGCVGTLSRIVNDDPEDFQVEVVALRLPDAGRAAWLALRKDAA